MIIWWKWSWGKVMGLSTVAQTVIGGVLVFVAGQIFLKSVIEPIGCIARMIISLITLSTMSRLHVIN